MFRKATLSDLNKAVIEQDRALEELMRNHRKTCQPSHRSQHQYHNHKSNKSALSSSRSSEFVPDDDMSLTLVKLRIQQQKTNELQKQYEQEVLKQQIREQIQKEQQLQQQQQQRMKMACKSPGTKSKKNNVLVIDVPCDTTLIIRSLPADSPQKPSIMKLSNSNKLVQMLKSLKPNKDPNYSNMTDTTTIVNDKLTKMSLNTPSSYCSKYNHCDSDISTIDDSYNLSPSSSIDSSQHRKSFYYL